MGEALVPGRVICICRTTGDRFPSYSERGQNTGVCISGRSLSLQKSREILLVLEGEQSAYVVAEQGGNSYAYDFIARDGDVWHPVSGIQTKPIVITQGSVVIRIYRYRKTDDYYISITDGKGQDVEIEDNRNSYFYTIGDSYALADETFSMYTYYAYICDLDETYQLTVNGEAFPVF